MYPDLMICTFRYPLRPTKAQEAVLDVYLWRLLRRTNASTTTPIGARISNGLNV